MSKDSDSNITEYKIIPDNDACLIDPMLLLYTFGVIGIILYIIMFKISKTDKK
jgi:hypothetical protein